MGMTKEQRKRVESLFHELLAVPEDQREAYLGRACPDDESVRQEAAALVQHYHSVDELDLLGAATREQQDPSADPVPARIGAYEVIGRLGKGGMGEVYLARDPKLGRKVAIKILPATLASHPDAVDRLRREALAASALNHPNILTVYEFGQDGGLQYIVSEYVEGKSLRELIGELSLEKAIDYARQIGQALAAAHQAGIIHRDIKPENVMVRPDGYVKVLDFGLAKVSATATVPATSVYARLAEGAADTVPGLLAGTINYMSPEQVRGQPLDQRTDIWSWGVVLYEMLAGKKPFDQESPAETLSAILERTPDLPSNDSSLKRCLSRAMAKELLKRYSTMAEALAELGEITAQTGHVIRFLPARSRLLQWAVVVLLLCAAAAAAFYRYAQGPHENARIDKIVRLTSTGDVLKSAISPDGDYVAYVTRKGSAQTLRLMQVSTGVDLVKLAGVEGEFKGITLRGGYIYYVLEVQSTGSLYRLPMLGGEAKLLKMDVDSPVSFAPDLGRYVFLRFDLPVRSLVLGDVRTGGETVLVKLASHEHFWATPLWSHDGKFVVAETFDDAGTMKLVSFAVADGQRRDIPGGPWSYLETAAWLHDRSLVVAAAAVHQSRAQLVQVSLDTGKVREIAGGLTDYDDVDTSADGREIVAVQRDVYSSIWIAPVTGQGNAQKLTASGLRLHGLTWSHSGRLIAQSESSGRSDLVAVDAQQGAITSLTEDDYVKTFPEATPDGKYLIYSANRDGTFHLWRSDADGSHSVRLTSDVFGEEEGVATPDGRWVIFTSLHSGARMLWKVPIEGGQPVPFIHHGSAMPSVSPDGKLIACEYLDEAAQEFKIAILRAQDGEFLRFLPGIPTGKSNRVRWSKEGKNIIYLSNHDGVGNVWAQPVDGGIPHQMTHFQEDEIFAIALAPNGESLACLRGRRIGDAVLARVIYE